MANILDAAPVVRTVKTHRYGTLEVTGLTIEGLVYIVKAHPKLLEMFKGEKLSLDFQAILDLGLEVVASFLAAGLGHPGNEKALAKCRSLNAEDAWSLGTAIVEESFPGGATNFFERMTEALGKQGIVDLKAMQDKAA